MVIVATAHQDFTNPLAAELSKIPQMEPGYDYPRTYWPSGLEIARYYEAQLDATDAFLQNLHQQVIYQIGHFNNQNILARVQRVQANIPLATSLIDEAFTQTKRYKMLAKLAAVLHYYALQYHLARYGGQNNPNPQLQDVNDFQNGNSRAKHAVTTITNNFQNSIQLACQRIVDDWLEINDLFFRDRILSKLLDIELTGSDFHKQGKQVLILKFEAEDPPPRAVRVRGQRVVVRRGQRQEVKLVYKPSDVELDCRLVGDTQALRNSVPAIFNANANDVRRLSPFISLFELINQQIIVQQIPDQDGRPFRLPTYRILPRRLGSDPNNPAAPPPIAHSYGYIEYLTHDPDWDGNGNPVPLESGDWITSAMWKLRYFYRLFGWYIGIALVFGLADSHQGNLIVHNCKPYLIDLEISLKWRTPVIERTGLNDVMAHGDYPYKCRLKYLTKQIFGQNQISSTIGTEAATHINLGIAEVITLLANTALAFNAWLNANQFDRVVARYTPRATADYGKRLRNVYRGSLSLLPLRPWTLQNNTVANINLLVAPQLGDAYVVTTNGILALGALNVNIGDLVEFDGVNWLKRLNSPAIAAEDYPNSYNFLARVQSEVVRNLNLAMPNLGDAYVVIDNGTLNQGNVNVSSGDVVEFDGGNWVKRSSYTMPFFDFLLQDCRTWYEAGGQGGGGRPNFATSNPTHDWECFRNCDYPAYYRRLGDMDLLNDRGAAVGIAQPSIDRARAKVKANLTIPGVDANGAVTYTAVQGGAGGINIRVAHAAGTTGIGHENRALAVNVAGNDITTIFGTDGAGASVVPTADQVVVAVNGNGNASALVGAQVGGTGNSNVTAQVLTNLNYPYPLLMIAGNDYFDYDIDGQLAVNALQMVIDQLNGLTRAGAANLIQTARQFVTNTYNTPTNIGF